MIDRAKSLLVLSSLLIASCASTTHVHGPPEFLTRTWTTTELDVSRVGPDAELAGFAEGRAQGVASGATSGAAAGAGGGLELALGSGPMFPVVAPLSVGGLAILGSAGGALWGGLAANSSATTQALRAALSTGLAGQDTADILCAAIREEARANATSTSVLPVDAAPRLRLEVSVDHAALRGNLCGDLLSLEIDVTARLIAQNNGRAMTPEHLSYRGAGAPVARWLEADGGFVRAELERGMSAVAQQVVDRFLLARELPLLPGYWALDFWNGLQPISPPAEFDAFPQMHPANAIVDSLRPTLRWEAFPGAQRAAELEHFEQRISEIVYDLDIWQARGGERGELVYRRRGLTESAHQVEQPLEPATQYFWSVRSRFFLDGRLRASPWSFARRPMFSDDSEGESTFVRGDPGKCSAVALPAANYMRFTTPGIPRADDR